MKKITLVSMAAFLILVAPGFLVADEAVQDTKSIAQTAAEKEATEAAKENIEVKEKELEADTDDVKNAATAQPEQVESEKAAVAENKETVTAASIEEQEPATEEAEEQIEEAATEQHEETAEEEEYDEELYGPEAAIVWTKPIEAVVFDHKIHTIEAGLDCESCHDDLFEMEAGVASENDDFTMETIYAGGYCGACHDGDTAFAANTRCASCHIGVMGMESDDEESDATEH